MAVHLGGHEVVLLGVGRALGVLYLVKKRLEVVPHQLEGLGAREGGSGALGDGRGGKHVAQAGDGGAAQLENGLGHLVDAGEQRVVQGLELGVSLEEVGALDEPVHVLQLVVLDGEVGEQGVELVVHRWVPSY